jgi:hypothetical protein
VTRRKGNAERHRQQRDSRYAPPGHRHAILH